VIRNRLTTFDPNPGNGQGNNERGHFSLDGVLAIMGKMGVVILVTRNPIRFGDGLFGRGGHGNELG
jgi:hypothetical protein